MKQYSLQQVSQLLASEDELLHIWCSLFTDMPVTCNEDQEALVDSFIFHLYDEVCIYFTKVYHSDFLSKTKSLLTEKKQSLHASLCPLKRKKQCKVTGDSEVEVKKDVTVKAVKQCSSLKGSGSTNEIHCGVCDLVCTDNPTSIQEQSIGCSSCDEWFHWHCVGVKGSDKCVVQDNFPWHCSLCIKTKKQRGKGRGKSRKK